MPWRLASKCIFSGALCGRSTPDHEPTLCLEFSLSTMTVQDWPWHICPPKIDRLTEKEKDTNILNIDPIAIGHILHAFKTWKIVWPEYWLIFWLFSSSSRRLQGSVCGDICRFLLDAKQRTAPICPISLQGLARAAFQIRSNLTLFWQHVLNRHSQKILQKILNK